MSGCHWPAARDDRGSIPEDWTAAGKAGEGAASEGHEGDIEEEPRQTKLIIEGVKPSEIEARGPQEIQELREWLIDRGYPVFDVRVANE